ncbi:importin subunit alpha-9-like [Magnolia sinica]|uniref:importin subunit alpha-9-like n=1 Tax=Magnolia sinica TaxID=86752 RepID=UPI002659B6D5|nr:importin subunit alpha-9-like [Magnolia sinica]
MPLFLPPSVLRPRSSLQGSSARTTSSSMLWEEGSMQRKVEVLHDLRHLLSKSKVPLVEAAFKVGAIPILVQCLSFGSPDEQV